MGSALGQKKALLPKLLNLVSLEVLHNTISCNLDKIRGDMIWLIVKFLCKVLILRAVLGTTISVCGQDATQLAFISVTCHRISVCNQYLCLGISAAIYSSFRF